MEVDKLSIKVECHFLNFLCVTPMAAPAIVKELYFPISFLVLDICKLLAEIVDPYRIEP